VDIVLVEVLVEGIVDELLPVVGTDVLEIVARDELGTDSPTVSARTAAADLAL
jgi:hypothetical protein